jgi:hypothetical protein
VQFACGADKVLGQEADDQRVTGEAAPGIFDKKTVADSTQETIVTAGLVEPQEMIPKSRLVITR